MSVVLTDQTKDVKATFLINGKKSTKTIKNIDVNQFEDGEGLEDFTTKWGKIYDSSTSCSTATVVNNEVYDIE